jgi:hypothetical protein
MTLIKPFHLEIPQADLDDLQLRLSRTRLTNDRGKIAPAGDMLERIALLARQV